MGEQAEGVAMIGGKYGRRIEEAYRGNGDIMYGLIPKQPSGSLSKAAKIYKSREAKEWLQRQKGRGRTELEYYDIISEQFRNVMQNLPVELAAIMDIVLRSYSKGITPKEIANVRLKSQTAIGSGLSRLKKAGLIKSRKDGRNSYYFVEDEDFLGVAAIRWDRRFMKFLKQNRHREEADLVSEFISQQTEGYDRR